jgi:hypothetical protein
MGDGFSIAKSYLDGSLTGCPARLCLMRSLGRSGGEARQGRINKREQS